MPYPENYETAVSVEKVIREQGAVPATIGILAGQVKIGMTENSNAGKCARRDIGIAVMKNMSCGTIVSGTLQIMSYSNGKIRIFATIIGGVCIEMCLRVFDISP